MADRAVGELFAVPTPPPRGGSFCERAHSISRSNSCGSTGSIARSLSFTRRRTFTSGMSLEDAREVLECANYAGAALRFAAAQQLLAEHFPTPEDEVEAPRPPSMPENTLRPSEDLKDIGPMPERKPAFATIKTPPPRPKTPPPPPPPPPTEDARYGAFNIAAPAMPTESKKVEETREEEEPAPGATGAMTAMRRFRMAKSSSKKQTTEADSSAETNVESSRNRSFLRNVSGSLSKKPAPDTEVKNVEVEKLTSPATNDKPTPSIVPNRSSRRNLLSRTASSKEKEGTESKSAANGKEPKSNDNTSPSLRIRVPRANSTKRADRPEAKHHEVGSEEKSPSGNVQSRSSRLRLPRVSSKQRFNDNEIESKKPDPLNNRGPPEDKPTPGLSGTLAARKNRMPRSASKKRADASDDAKLQEPNSERFGDKQTPGMGRNRSIRRFVLARSSSKKRVNSSHGTDTAPSSSNPEGRPTTGLARSRSMMRHFRMSLSASKKNAAEKEKEETPTPAVKPAAEKPPADKPVAEKPPAEKPRAEKQETVVAPVKATDLTPIEPQSRVVSKELTVASNEAVKKRGPSEDSPALKRMDSKAPATSTPTPQVTKNKTPVKPKPEPEPAADVADADKDLSKRRFLITSKRRSTSVVPSEQSASGSSKHVTFQDPRDSQHEREARRTLPPDAERPNLGPKVQRVRNLLSALKLRTKFNKNSSNSTRVPKPTTENMERRDSTEKMEFKTPIASQPLRRSRSEKKMVVKSQKPVEKSADPGQAVGSLGNDEVDTVSDEPVRTGEEKLAGDTVTKSVPLVVEEPTKDARPKDRPEKPYKPSATPTKPPTTSAKKTTVAKEETGSKSSASKTPTSVDRGTAAIGSVPATKAAGPARSPSEKFLKAKAVFSNDSGTDLAQSNSAPVVRVRKEARAMPRSGSEKKVKEVKTKSERKEEKASPRKPSGTKIKEAPQATAGTEQKAKSKALPRNFSGEEARSKTPAPVTTPNGERKEAKPMPRASSGSKRQTAKSSARTLSDSNMKDISDLQGVVCDKQTSLPRSSSSKQSIGVPAAVLASVEPEPMRKTGTNGEEERSENTRKVHVSTDVRRVRMPGSGKELVVTDMPVESAGPRIRRKKTTKAKRRTFANLPRVDLTIA